MASVNGHAFAASLQQESLVIPWSRGRSMIVNRNGYKTKRERYCCRSLRDTIEALVESPIEPASPSREDQRHAKLEGGDSAELRKRENFHIIECIDTIKGPCPASKSDPNAEGMPSRTLVDYQCSSSSPSHTRVENANISVNIDGILIAVVALVSGIVGRVSSQELRYDATRLYRLQESSRAVSMELRKKREAWKSEEDVRVSDLQKQRVQRAREKAIQEAERQRKLQEKFEMEAKQEAERQKQQMEISKREYEERQKVLDTEYQERQRKEQLALEAARRIEREQREAQERERQLVIAKQKEEQQRKELLEAQAREEAAATRKAAMKQARKEMSKFAVTIEGRVSVLRPESGTLMPGPLQQEAGARLLVDASCLVSGSVGPVQIDYEHISDLLEDAPKVLGSTIRKTTDSIQSTLQLQAMSGEGPLTLMDDPEVRNWMYISGLRTCLQAMLQCEIVVKELKRDKSVAKEFKRAFRCRTESGVLPSGHPLSYDSVFSSYVERIIESPGSIDLLSLFEEYMMESNTAFYQDCNIEVDCLAQAPQNMGFCAELAHFVDWALHTRPAHESDAPAWFEACVEYCRRCTRKSFENTPDDSLDAYSKFFCQVLAPGHPIAEEIKKICFENTSEERRFVLKEKERSFKSRLAVKLLEEEWPDEEEIRKARAQDREAKTPVAERIWALKNVAGTLSMGNAGEVSKARQFLEQAVLLKQKVCCLSDHPAVFPEALALLKVIRERNDWQMDAAGVATLFMRIILNISSACLEIDNPLLAAIVLEYGLRQCEDAVSLRSNTMIRGVKALEKAVATLSLEDSTKLTKARTNTDRIENYLVKALTDELGAYQDGIQVDKHILWDQQGATILRGLSDLF
eukprot:jgi/Picsp_1/4428/NSC_06650-R1_expressed protein [Chlorella variabilis]